MTPLEFSQIVAAVSPRERGDQYYILAALYTLGAHRAPVTARQVTDVLGLHLRARDRPTNVSASLRSYVGLVAPRERRPRISWQLTPAGLDRLRQLSGLALVTPSASTDFDKDIGVVCALEDPEFTAVLEAFGGHQTWQMLPCASYSHVYRERQFPLPGGQQLTIVGTTASSMGLTAAAIATTQLILRFRPRFVLMIGIAAGTKTGHKQFGDVLVADPSVDYSSGKIISNDGVRKFLPDPYPIGINARLRSLLKTYLGRPGVFADIRAAWGKRTPAEANALHVGPVGAADQVIDDIASVVEIQDHWRKLIGIEMESYGVYRACIEAPDPKPRFASFKSVCDFAEAKDDSWQSYAAFVSARFAATFIEREWINMWQ